MMIMLYYGGYSKRPIIDPASVQLQNNCTVVGSYAHRLLYSANNRCTIIIYKIKSLCSIEIVHSRARDL